MRLWYKSIFREERHTTNDRGSDFSPNHYLERTPVLMDPHRNAGVSLDKEVSFLQAATLHRYLHLQHLSIWMSLTEADDSPGMVSMPYCMHSPGLEAEGGGSAMPPRLCM